MKNCYLSKSDQAKINRITQKWYKRIGPLNRHNDVNSNLRNLVKIGLPNIEIRYFYEQFFKTKVVHRSGARVMGHFSMAELSVHE